MKNDSNPKPLAEKVLRRHFELLKEILTDFSTLVFEQGRPADSLLNHYLRNHRELGSRDRRFLSQAFFSYFRWYGWTAGRLGLNPVEACLLGSLLDLSEQQPSLEYIQQQTSLPAELAPIGRLSLSEKCDTLNQWFSETLNNNPLKLTDLLPPAYADCVDHDAIEPSIEQFQTRPPTWLRSRIEPENFIQLLDSHGIAAHAHPHLTSAICTESGKNLTHILGKQAGTFCVQDLSSQCVAQACTPATGEDWWDCCAGAGGKSLHLMDLMQEGKLLASDVRANALKELKKRARHHGIRNIRTQPFNAATEEPFRKTFDGVLVDAPCSGWGTWGRNPDARWRTSAKEVAQCANRQLKILENSKWCVKSGGALVFAVCTLTRPETEDVVNSFLERNDRFKLDPFQNPLTGEETNGTLQVWPWDGPGDAMFIARFKRMD